MLPTIKEQDKKLKVLVDKYPEDKDMCYEDIFKFAKRYAKWYAIEIIKHCSEVAMLKGFDNFNAKEEILEFIEDTYELQDNETDEIYLHVEIDKQSILNVINEL